MTREPDHDPEQFPDAVLEAAAHWQLCCEDPRDDAMDWDAFTAWLDADPRHRAAFDEMALAADALGEHRDALAAMAPANDDHDENHADDGHDAPLPARRGMGRLRWTGLAIAAAGIALVARPMLFPAPVVYATETADRTIALDDGSSVLLAPHSRLTVEGRGQDRMALSGGAYFDIRHDPSRALAVTAGDLVIRDIGTRFDVQSGEAGVRVAVAQGHVSVSAATMDAPVALDAGKRLAYDPGAGTAAVAAVAPGDVGAWKDGRLTYDDAPLALVLADLHRYAGVAVEAPKGLASQRFTGTLIVEDGTKALRDLVELMDLRLGGGPGHWRIERR